MDVIRTILIILAVVVTIFMLPLILILLGTTMAIAKWIILGVGILLLPIIIGIVTGFAIGKNKRDR